MTRHAPVVAALLLALTACGGDGAVRTQPADDLPGAAAAPCPPEDNEGNADIDWVPFVKVGEQMYVAAGASGPITVAPGLVGETVAEVSCRIGDVVGNPEFRARAGDAAYLPAGTELHRFGEARPDRRLAVPEDGQWRVYEATEIEGADRGSALLDISPETVTRVELRDGDTATTVIGEVTAAAEVADLTRAVLDAPVVQPDWDSMDEGPVFVRFELRDGTFVERAWHVDSGYLASRIEAPEELKLLLGKG